MKFEEWICSLKSRSAATAEVYSRRLQEFCKFVGLSAEELLELEEGELIKLVDEYVSSKTPAIVRVFLSAIRNWFRVNGKEVNIPISVPRKREELSKVPSAKEVAKAIVYAPTLRAKLLVAFLAFTGVRPGVLATEDGSNGLRLKHLPEVEIRSGKVKVPQKPLVVIIPKSLSRSSSPHLTFFPKSMVPLLKAYLEEREINSKEELLFSKKAVCRESITSVVRKALRLAGLSCSPQSLRGYFRMRLIDAEVRGEVPSLYIEYWLGNSNTLIKRCFANGVPEEVIEIMRSCYDQCEKYLVYEGLRELTSSYTH